MPNVIRGQLILGAWVLQQLESGQTDVTMLLSYDYKGHLPKWSLSFAFEPMAELLDKLPSIIKGFNSNCFDYIDQRESLSNEEDCESLDNSDELAEQELLQEQEFYLSKAKMQKLSLIDADIEIDYESYYDF